MNVTHMCCTLGPRGVEGHPLATWPRSHFTVISLLTQYVVEYSSAAQSDVHTALGALGPRPGRILSPSGSERPDSVSAAMKAQGIRDIICRDDIFIARSLPPRGPRIGRVS